MKAHIDIPTDPHERAAWVIYRLKARRSSIAAVGRAGGWDRGMVRRALFQPSFAPRAGAGEGIGPHSPAALPGALRLRRQPTAFRA